MKSCSMSALSCLIVAATRSRYIFYYKDGGVHPPLPQTSYIHCLTKRNGNGYLAGRWNESATLGMILCWLFSTKEFQNSSHPQCYRSLFVWYFSFSRLPQIWQICNFLFYQVLHFIFSCAFSFGRFFFPCFLLSVNLRVCECDCTQVSLAVSHVADGF